MRSKPPNVDIDWSLGDWPKHKADAEALGEYYLTKAMALEDAFARPHPKKQSKHSKQSKRGSSLAYDWLQDPEYGIELAKMYGKIGETIEDHYREAFGHSSGKHHFRMLKARGKKGPPSTPSSRLSWQEDWKRGLKIAHCFENLSNVIIDHYFDLLFDE